MRIQHSIHESIQPFFGSVQRFRSQYFRLVCMFLLCLFISFSSSLTFKRNGIYFPIKILRKCWCERVKRVAYEKLLLVFDVHCYHLCGVCADFLAIHTLKVKMRYSCLNPSIFHSFWLVFFPLWSLSGLFYDQVTEFYCGYLTFKVDKQNVRNGQFTKNN